jgi:MFS family permease
VVSPRERGRYQGYIGSMFGLATVAGPLAGGFLVEHGSWRWTFWVGIPIGIVALLVTERALRFGFPRRRRAIDWLGALFIVASVSALLLVLSLGGKEFAWNSAWTYGLLAITVLTLGAAIWQERRATEPIMPPHLFTNRTFLVTSLTGFMVGVAMFGAIIFLPQYLQIVKGESSTASGLLTVPLVAGLLITSIVSGRIITRTGRYKIFPVFGMFIAAVGLSLLSLLDVHTLARHHRCLHAGHRPGYRHGHAGSRTGRSERLRAQGPRRGHLWRDVLPFHGRRCRRRALRGTVVTPPT